MLVLAPIAASAQTDVEELGRRYGATPPPGFYEILRSHPNAFQFSPDNGWIRRGRRVAEVRNRLRGDSAEGVFRTQAAHDENGVMTGDVYVPVFLVLFSNTDSADIASNVPREALQTRLYGTDLAPPYSVHTYYREVSNDLVNVYGTVFDWAFVPGADSTYEGDNNGLSGVLMGPMMRDAAAVLDDSVDFGQFDNDGLDGIPNSGDDDGYVDAVVMIHPKVDGSCQAVNSEAENSIWAHRFSAGPYPTNDVSVATGEFVRLHDYIVQGGQGGDAGCTSDEPQAMGVVAHETGHLFGLSDLYEVGGDGSGIGHWGLMGSGSQRTATRPAHMNAWSKAQLGWVTEVRIDRDTTLVMNPVVTSDTTYVLPIPNTTEFFMLENRQPIGSDSMLHRAGLLIWHVDSYLADIRGNAVNGPIRPYGVALEQADGEDHLDRGVNRGDTGDPFPGRTNNRSFGRNTTPSSHSNRGLMSFVELDSIQQIEAFGAMRLNIGFEAPALIAATDTNAVFRLDGVEHNRYDDFLRSGADYALDIDSLQVADSGRRRFEWVSWSNGQPRSHVFTASSTGDTIVANVAAEYELIATYSGTGMGTVNSDVPLDLVSGTFLTADSVVTLVATVDSVGHVFEGWYGSDTTATGDTLVLQMTHPFTLEGRFAAPLVVADDSFPTATMGTDFRHQLTASGGIGGISWALASGTLPVGLALNSSGLVAGLPEQTGSFSLALEVSSGSQSIVDTLELAVLAPVLTVGDVLKQLVGEGTPLSEQDIVYLDLLGNRNSWLDVGDFLGWVEATGGLVTAEEMAAALKAARSAVTGNPGEEQGIGEGGRRP
jgi:M6 family metalloprotease-like protein